MHYRKLIESKAFELPSASSVAKTYLTVFTLTQSLGFPKVQLPRIDQQAIRSTQRKPETLTQVKQYGTTS